MPKDDIKDKIQQYEEFLNETLRNDLRKLLEDRDKIYEEQAEFLSLRNSIKAGCIIMYTHTNDVWKGLLKQPFLQGGPKKMYHFYKQKL